MNVKGKTGLIVTVYTDGSDCTNGGVTSKHKSFVLIGEGVEGPFEPTEHHPALAYVEEDIGFTVRKIARPVDPETGEILGGQGSSMFGGNFVWTSDSRFPTEGPIKVHDRFEP